MMIVSSIGNRQGTCFSTDEQNCILGLRGTDRKVFQSSERQPDGGCFTTTAQHFVTVGLYPVGLYSEFFPGTWKMGALMQTCFPQQSPIPSFLHSLNSKYQMLMLN